MTAPHIVDPASVLAEALTDASPDLMRSLLQTMINALRALLARSVDSNAREFARLLDHREMSERVAVSSVFARDLLPTYQARLERSESGVGPRTRGLVEFVDTLRNREIVEMFVVSTGGVVGIGLIDPRGNVPAVTMILGGAE